MQYDSNNIFAKMIAGEFSAHKVVETDSALVIMDAFPQSKGHVLIIPKAPSRNLLDADPAVLAAIMPLIQRVAVAVKQVTGADGIRLAQSSEAAAGQSVFHLHFHIIPVVEGASLGTHGSEKADDSELAELASQIAAALQ
ncbi:HIT family protein [Devosia algicola]|uniref:HIT family protein n=1 Tax=Devosia algicola TaxID=3026418 RepID=A0ABY7YQ15_9HYPH|nr:HIT family protein [Devosia algicola]WDR03408.1 HIT family protein [Devosia algicola]